jgi:dCTP deaminase
VILTGSKIKEEIANGSIEIEPFCEEQVNPNSYNYRLGSTVKVFKYFDDCKPAFEEIDIPQDGLVLTPGTMYLANTLEVIGSKKYAMSLIGRSSMGRYGLFLQVSANLGHTASKHRWTLEIVAALPTKVYSGMIIGQVSFWGNYGKVDQYNGRYGFISHPQESFIQIERNNKNI